MNAVSTIAQGARRELAPIEKLKANLASSAAEFKTALPSHISVEKFQRTIATAVMSNPQLLDCDRRSLLLACMKLAQDGLLPDGREAALVKFEQRYKGEDDQWYSRDLVQPMPMAYGLRKKILQSGQVVSLETGVVYRAEVESGHFIYEIGLEPPIRHRPSLDLTDEQMDDSEIVAAYSIARIRNENGDPYWSVEVMRRSEINKVRQMSQTGAEGRTVKYGKNKGNPIAPKGPWVDWFGEMAKKTVLRRHSKVLPMSGDILDTIDREDEVFAAEGTARLLETEEAAPLRLPTSDELDAQAEQEGATIDHDTGEVTTNAAGMTETDEATARALDAGEAGEDDTQDNGEDDEPEAAADDAPAYAQFVAEIKAGIGAAKNGRYLNGVEDKFVQQRAALPDDVASNLDALFAQRRREFRQAASEPTA